MVVVHNNMPVSVEGVTVKAVRRQRHMPSWLGKAAVQLEESTDAARAKEKAKLEAVGVLKSTGLRRSRV